MLATLQLRVNLSRHAILDAETMLKLGNTDWQAKH